MGGGAIFFAKPKVESNWLNDLDKDIMITYQIMADVSKRSELIGMFEGEVATKERHTEIKYSEPRTDLERAFKTFYLSRTSYSGIINKPAWGYHPLKSVPPERWGKRIEEAGKKLEGSKLTNYDFSKIIRANGQQSEEVFMFVDPPYFKADQKRAYTHSFTEKEHYRLVEELKKTDYAFCLTYDNCEEIKDLYDWANIKEVSWRYHTANSNKATRKMGQELIITNF